MKKSTFLTLLLGTAFIVNCNAQSVSKQKAHLKAAIAKAEKDFETFVAEKGIAEGFYHFAAEDAVIKRENDTLIKGRENIRKYYSNPRFAKASVTWAPDFIDVSEKGDMAYTYGKYTWITKDAAGNIKTSTGVFHTVWRKQSDGTWKYVWD